MSWTALTGPHLDTLAARLGLKSRPADLQGIMREPSWYKTGALLRLHSSRRVVSFIAAGPGAIVQRPFFMLDGSALPVHEGNEAADIKIRTADEAADYLRFFCSSITGGNGSFNVLDGMVPGWTVEGARQPEVTPPRITATDDPGLFIAKAWVEYDGGLFMAAFSIQRDGMVEMTDDEPVGMLTRDPAAPSLAGATVGDRAMCAAESRWFSEEPARDDDPLFETFLRNESGTVQ